MSIRTRNLIWMKSMKKRKDMRVSYRRLSETTQNSFYPQFNMNSASKSYHPLEIQSMWPLSCLKSPLRPACQNLSIYIISQLLGYKTSNRACLKGLRTYMEDPISWLIASYWVRFKENPNQDMHWQCNKIRPLNLNFPSSLGPKTTKEWPTDLSLIHIWRCRRRG